MKGFIEVNIIGSNKKDLLSIYNILRVSIMETVVITNKEVLHKHMGSGDNRCIRVQESYEQIKELIKQAQ